MSYSLPPKSFPNPKITFSSFNPIQQPVQLCQEPLMTWTFAMSLVNLETESLQSLQTCLNICSIMRSLCAFVKVGPAFLVQDIFWFSKFSNLEKKTTWSHCRLLQWLSQLLLVTVTITTCSNMSKFEGRHIYLSTSLMLNNSLMPNACHQIVFQMKSGRDPCQSNSSRGLTFKS